MIDPRKHVRPGQPLALAASQVNFLNSLMQASSMPAAGPLGGWNFTGNQVLVKNSTASNVPRWGVLQITDILLDPNDGDVQRREYESMPCVVGSTPSGVRTQKLVIAVEPIAVGKIGRCAIGGVTQAKLATGSGVSAAMRARATDGDVTVLTPDLWGPVEILWRNDEWALVRLDQANPVQLGKTTAEWAKGATATIDVYEGSPLYETNSLRTLSECVNKFVTVANDKWVIVAQAGSGYWYLIAAEC